jgi:hypothetical protein
VIERLGKSVGTLLNILETCRENGSAMENKFVDAIFKTCRKAADENADWEVWQDEGGNVLVSTDQHATTLFTCHTDTCHWGAKTPRHTLRFYEEDGDIFVGTKDGDCLGADDGTGAWLMLAMIGAGVPGLYIFHRAEEVGCKGSRWIADNTPDVLEGIERAIAFDRKGYDDVVEQQVGHRCASQKFAKKLGKALGFDHSKCNPIGSVTDTAQYMDDVSECTNISVGYFYQHGPREIQNLSFAVALRDKLLQTDFESLTPHRDPYAANEAITPRSPPPAQVQTTQPQGDLFAKATKPPTMAACIAAVVREPRLVAMFLFYIGHDIKRMEKVSDRFPSKYADLYREAYDKHFDLYPNDARTH